MATKAKIAKSKKVAKMVAQYAAKRKALKEAGDWDALALLPRNSSKTRMTNRCSITGRNRGYIREYGLSRITFRELARKGELPGVKKSSW
jgi:small subunit ribosomal protein S14